MRFDMNKRMHIDELTGFQYTPKGVSYPEHIQPKHFFKYYGINKYSLDAFVNEYLFFAHPNQLNDIMDTQEFLYDLSSCTRKHHTKSYEYYFEKYELDGTAPDFNEHKMHNFYDLSKWIHFDKFFNRGLLSLTTTPFNNLMMPHYTQEKGFVLDFDSKALIDDLKDSQDDVFVFPMNYKDQLVPIDYFKNVFKRSFIMGDERRIAVDDIIPMLYISSSKDINWKYEDEWRILLQKPMMGYYPVAAEHRIEAISPLGEHGRKVMFPEAALNRIILAPHFFNTRHFELGKKLPRQIVFKCREENLISDNLFELMKEFLEKLASDDYRDKVFLQNIFKLPSGWTRACHKLEEITFSENTIRFYYGRAYGFDGSNFSNL